MAQQRIFCVLAALWVAMAAGCGSGPASRGQPGTTPAAPGPGQTASPSVGTPAAPRQLQTVRLGILGNTSDAGLLIAMDRGYFEQEGIRIEPVPFDTAARMVAPLSTGQLDVGGGAVSAGLFNAIARGTGIKIVADKGSFRPGFGYTWLMVRQDLAGTIKDLRDLKGRKVAIAGRYTSPHLVLARALAQVGVKETEVEWVEMAHKDMLVAFKQKGIDAGMVTEPNAVQTEAEGLAVRWIPGDKLVPGEQNAVLLYAAPWAEQNPDLATGFMVAYLRGVRDFNAAFAEGKDRARIVKILTDHTPLKDPALYDKMTMPGLDPEGKVNRDRLAEVLAFLQQHGQISGQVDLDKAIDLRFAQRAVSRLGSTR